MTDEEPPKDDKVIKLALPPTQQAIQEDAAANLLKGLANGEYYRNALIMAKCRHAAYKANLEAGFTPEEAMQLIISGKF